MSSPVLLEKIEKLTSDGSVALRTGQVKPFTGFPEKFDRTFSVSLKFFEGRAVQDALNLAIFDWLRPVKGIELYRVITDFFLHTTLLEGVWEGSPSVAPSIFELVSNDPRLKRVAAMPPVTIAFSRLVPAFGTLIMNSVDMLRTVAERRAALAAVYREYGLTVLPMDDILHSTLGRLTKIDAGTDIGGYLQEVGAMDRILEGQPLVLTSTEVYVGPPRGVLKRIM